MSLQPLSYAVPGFKGALERLADLRGTMSTLERQLATGRTAESHAGIVDGRDTVLALRARLSAIGDYERSIDDLGLRMRLATDSVARVSSAAREQQTDLTLSNFDPGANGITSAQVAARGRLDLMIDALNVDVAGRYLFSGRSSDVRPVETAQTLIDGRAGQAGLRQLIVERKAADTGADGLGRLSVAATGASVALSETAAGLPFGFRVGAVSTSGAGLSATGPTGSPASATFAVTGSVSEGATIALTLDLPDGTREILTLTATSSAAIAAQPGYFLTDAAPAATAANLQSAVSGAIAMAAQTVLASASAMLAGQDFFAGTPSNPALRVDGPPFDTAIALRAGAAGETVDWYRGEDGPTPARQTSQVRLDARLSVGAGARAGEPAFGRALVSAAVVAAETFSAGDAQRFAALAQRVRGFAEAAGGAQRLADIGGELGLAAKAGQDAKARHRVTADVVQDRVSGLEEADPQEVAARLLALRTRLEASYQATAILTRLNLAQFLG